MRVRKKKRVYMQGKREKKKENIVNNKVEKTWTQWTL
jgi:hypothetical protein